MEKKQLKGLRSERVEMMVEEIRGQEVRGEGLCIFLVSGPGTALVDDQLHDQDGARGTLPRNFVEEGTKAHHCSIDTYWSWWSFADRWGRLAALNALQQRC